MSDSWGNLYRPTQDTVALNWRTDSIAAKDQMLAVGNRRSYGDVCVNDGGTVIDLSCLNKFIAFDRANGILRCEAGVTLWQVAKFCVPQGWFLPVTPGTGFVTVGGAVANDVHGKNHHVSGSFGCFVKSLGLRRSKEGDLTCSGTENPSLYAATIGGLGLTGTITWVEIQLKSMRNSLMDVESIEYNSYEEFLSLSSTSENSHEYCVSWIDCLSNTGRGVFFRANHADTGSLDAPLDNRARTVPSIVGAGVPLVNQLSLKLFNKVYMRTHSGTRSYNETIAKFFYPLDSLLHWNRIYGRKGFYQFQCVVPYDNASVLTEILAKISKGRQGSFLSVLKTMGSISSPALLSFCRPGVTLALDFPNRGARTRNLLAELEKITMEAGGAIYPAKDATMSPDTFEQSFPKLSDFTQYIDPAYTSSFWQRVQGT